MSHTYHQLLYHLVWSTKERKPLILNEFQSQLYAYMAGIFRSLKCSRVLVGGMPDHIHVCVAIPPSVSVADVIRTVKMRSSKWVKQHHQVDSNFEWQEGYGGFSISESNWNSVVRYIENQERHHKKRDFREEFLLMLQKHQVQYDEKFLWL